MHLVPMFPIRLVVWLLLALPLPLTGRTATAEAILDCAVVGHARPICGFQNPEDLAALPGHQALVVSEYGAVEGDAPGRLALYRLADDARQVLYEGGARPAVPRSGWGDPDCTTPPTASFSPHGIDLFRRDDGRLALLVVQHGDREAVEIFEALGVEARWHLEWRGCVLAPRDASLNDVVGLPDGRFYATKMMSTDADIEAVFANPGEPTGLAFAWRADRGWRPIPGTEGLMPNGIEASEDGRVIYLNVSGEHAIRKIEVESGHELGRATVASPDNVTWSSDRRRLLVASLTPEDPMDFQLCRNLAEGACPLAFSIVEIDPESMINRGAIYTGGGPPMGAGTVGLEIGGDLFIGSFAGDRILRVDLGGR